MPITRAHLVIAAIFVSLLSACTDDVGESAPDVRSVTPADGATAVEPDQVASAEFNTDMLGSSVDSSSVHLTRNGQEQASTVSFDGANNTVTITPEQPMRLLGEYQVTLDASIADLSGEPMASSHSWSFSVREGTWRAAETIELQNAGPATDPQIAFDGSGNALAVWEQDDGTRLNIRANRYIPSTGWGNAQTIETENAGDAKSPQIAFDGSGNALVVWEQYDGTRFNIRAIRYTTDSGWGSAQTIEANNAGDARGPQIAIDGEGNALAVWRQNDGTRTNIRANRFNPEHGWNDTAETIEAEDAGGTIDPQIAFDGEGNALAVWVQHDGTRYNVRANRFDANNGWGAAETIETENDGDAADPQIAFDAAGNALAVWDQYDGTNYNIRANRFDADNGWGAAETIEAKDDGDAILPQVAVDGEGNALAVWAQLDGTRFNIRANRFDADNGWGTAETIETDNDGGASDPQIAFDGAGNALAVWEHSDGSRFNIRVNRYTRDNGWGSAESIEADDTGSARDPQIAFDRSGRALAVWEQVVGTRNIRANRFD
ncbi:Ig-like domain-containing protein [Saccharospirillum salsuginis]|uniref:SbsA Ig-like domain-containing protein n=1 Tax=Saccharospirillum salsuginis TaxID=418750 RepID=A0A918K5W6_9GAMM|nr:Ig-like domain-containing protein [Saccharospirillum salsuginis]GGX48740.1 hypothetical protein GCM10007392_14840 [Saccharospirillum salsuginis]